MKRGIKTSEFWVFLAGLGAVLWGYLQPKCNFQATDVIAIATMVSTYIGGRSWLKSRQVKK